MAATARSGCMGVNHWSAPDAPSASSTILLHTGQPTAKKVSTPPATPNRDGRSSRSCVSGADPGSRTYVANTSPLSTAVTMSTGQDHHVTPTSRPKMGVGIIAVGTATTSTVMTAVAIAAPHRRVDQLLTYTPRSMYVVTLAGTLRPVSTSAQVLSPSEYLLSPSGYLLSSSG